MEGLSFCGRTALPSCPGPDPSLPRWRNLSISCINSFFLTPGSPSANSHALVSPILKETRSAFTTNLFQAPPHFCSPSGRNLSWKFPLFSFILFYFLSILSPCLPPPHTHPRSVLKRLLLKLPRASLCQIQSLLFYLTPLLKGIQNSVSSFDFYDRTPVFSPLFTSFFLSVFSLDDLI